MITTPSLFGALFLAGSGIWLASLLFWQGRRPVFWFSCALILVGTGYLVATGAAEQIAYSLWPTLNADNRLKPENRLLSQFDTLLGVVLLGVPMIIAFFLIWWRRGAFPLGVAVLMGGSVLLLHMSAIPGQLARAVFSDEALGELARQLGRQ